MGDEFQKLKRPQLSPFSGARVVQPGRPLRPVSTRLKTGNSFRNENCRALSQVQIELKCGYFAVLSGIRAILWQLGFRASIGRNVESWVLRISGVEMLSVGCQ